MRVQLNVQTSGNYKPGGGDGDDTGITGVEFKCCRLGASKDWPTNSMEPKGTYFEYDQLQPVLT